jgi:chitodextrinase
VLVGTAIPAHAFWPSNHGNTNTPVPAISRNLRTANLHEAQNGFPAVPAGATRTTSANMLDGHAAYIIRNSPGNNFTVSIWILNDTGNIVAFSNDITATTGAATNQDRLRAVVGNFGISFGADAQGRFGTSLQINSYIESGTNAENTHTVKIWATGRNNWTRQVSAAIIDNATGNEIARDENIWLRGSGQVYVNVDNFVISLNRAGGTNNSTVGNVEILYTPTNPSLFPIQTGMSSGTDAEGIYRAFVLPTGVATSGLQNPSNQPVHVWVIDIESGEVVAETDEPLPHGAIFQQSHYVGEFGVRWTPNSNSATLTDVSIGQVRVRPERPVVTVPELPEIEEDEYDYEEYEDEGIVIDWDNILPLPIPTVPVIPPVEYVPVITLPLPAPVIPMPTIPENLQPMPMPTVPAIPPVEEVEIDWDNVAPMPMPTVPVIPPVVEDDEIIYEDDDIVYIPEIEAGQCGIGIAGEFAAWNASSVFNTGDRVIFDGRLFEAQWWTQNDTPGVNVHGSWMEIAAITLNGDVVYCWTASRVFNTGDIVYFDGNVFEAQWFTRNEQPGLNPWGAWMQLATTDNVESSVEADPAHDVWTADRVFTGGETVYFDGYLWSAQWWTRNQKPGADAHGPWRNLGRA